MKKRKISLWLNIVTICLSICAIAIGVYSLKKSSLNINGTVGFVVHNVRATVSAKIRGDAVNGTTPSAGGTPRAGYATIGNTVNINGTESTTPTLDLSDFYFSDLGGSSGVPADIYLKISVTNNSAFNIKVYFDVPNITGVTATIGEGYSSYLKLGKATDSDKAGDIVLKLSLNANDSGDYDNLTTENNLNLTMHLEKYEDYYVKSITESVYNGTDFADVTTSRLCTQLGHGTKEDLNGAEFKQLEWYAFAVKGLDTGKGYMYNNAFYENGTANGTLADRWYTLYGVDVNNDLTITVNGTNKSLKGHQLWFIQQYTVGGGYTKDAKLNYVTGKKFNADISQETANTYGNAEYQSDIYKYLNNDTSNKCDSRTENNTYILDTGISYDKHYKSTISADSNKRAVNETAKTKYKYGGTDEITVKNNFTSTFWLLNYTELGLAYDKPLGQTNYKYFVKNFSIGKTDGVEVSNKPYGALWWLRSPYENEFIFAHCVHNNGYFYYNGADNTSVGVRAAFQIQI